jgi:TP901 family phage tail tape measure protein
MSNPSVTATVTVDDKASPRLRELVELSQKMSRTAQAAFNESGANKYAANLNAATAAARQHLTVLESIHKVQGAIAATAAGVVGAKALSVAKNAVSNYIPYERDVRYQRAIQGYSASEMALLERQRVSAASVYGLKPEDTLHAQQAFVTRNFSAAITEAGTKQAIILSKALNVPAADAAKIVEGLTFGQGIHLKSAADASREIAKSTDVAAIAAKSGSMTPEDIQQFSKFGIGMSTAAGISPQQAFATAMTLKRANVGGDESGVFMRQMSARLLAPTKQAFEAFAHMGIDYGQFATQGSVSPEAIDASLRRRYGKGLSDEGKAKLSEAFGDESRNVLGNREEYTTAVREAVEASGKTLDKTEQKHVVETALRQYDLAKGGLRGGDLFNEILSKASPRDMQAIIGDKQGGRAVMLLSALDQYREYREKLTHGDGYAQKIAEERMQGLAAATDRFAASLDVASKQMVAANERWMTPLTDAAGKAVNAFTGLSDNTKAALSVGGGLASLAGLASAGATLAGVVASLTSLSASANVAAAALTRISVTGAAGTVAGAAGAAGAGAGAARVAAGLGGAASLLGWAAAASVIVPTVYGFTNDEAQGVTRDHSRANLAREAIKADADARMARELAKQGDEAIAPLLPAPERRGGNMAYRRSLSQSLDEQYGTAGGSKDVSVSGTVTGSAELHQNITVDVRPTAYLESIVKRAESVANMSLNGRLGTSMQGPGDNGTKPSAGAPTGTQQ